MPMMMMMMMMMAMMVMVIVVVVMIHLYSIPQANHLRPKPSKALKSCLARMLGSRHNEIETECIPIVPQHPADKFDTQPEDFHTHPLIAAPHVHQQDEGQKVD